MKNKKFLWFEVTNAIIVKTFLLVLAIVTGFMTLIPEFGKGVGERMNYFYSYIPQIGYGIIFIGLLAILLVWSTVDYLSKKQSAKSSPETSNQPIPANTTKIDTVDFSGAKIKDSTIIVGREDKKKDHSENILRIYDKTSRLMDRAIKDADDFGIMIERNDGRTRKERKELAFKSKDAFNKFYESNKQYFPLPVRNDITKLDELTERSLRSLAICFNTMENMERDLNTPPHQTLMPQQIIEIHGDFLSRSKVIQDRILESFLDFREGLINVPQEKAKRFEKFDITPSVVLNDKKWISVIVPNPTNQTLECYCRLNSVSLNGKINESIKRYVSAHSSRISWSGGDTAGKGEGVKVIDINDDSIMLNIVTPTKEGLGFEMAKGTRFLGDDFEYGVGTYEIGLDIRYRTDGERDFQSKAFDINLICYIDESKIDKKSMPSDAIRCDLSPQIFFGNESRKYLYVKIL